MITVKFKKLDKDAFAPSQANNGDAGYDICSIRNYYIKPYRTEMVRTGLAVEIPEGYEIQVRGKSGIASKKGLTVAQGVGTIDSGYRGEVCVLLHNLEGWTKNILEGDMVAQLVLKEVPEVTYEEVDKLSDSERGSNGFGSTQERKP